MINIPNIVRDWLEQYHKNLGKKDEPLLNRFVRYSFLFFLISLPCWYIYNGCFLYSKEYAVRKEMSRIPVPVACSVFYPRKDKSVFFATIEEQGNNGQGIKEIEKWLLQNGYQKNGEKYYEKGNYLIKKSYYPKENETVLWIEYDCDTSWFGMFKDIYNRIFNPDLE